MLSPSKPAALKERLLILLLAVCASTHAQPAPQTQLPPAPPTSSSSLSGLVLDPDGDDVDGAHVTLKTASVTLNTTTDDSGRFNFSGAPPGAYTLTIAMDGFVTLSTSGMIHPATAEQLPKISLLLAAVDTDIEVTVSRKDLAEAEVKVEEHQRLLGVLPNFYVSYDWHAAPLDARQKYELGWKSVIDPVTIVINAGIAGVEQYTNAYSGYGQGAAGYFKRFGAASADTAIGTMLGGSILPALFHQDPRYFYMGPRARVMHRFLYALATAVIARGDNGHWQFAYAAILGDLGAGAAANIYYPASSRQGVALTFENGFIGIAEDGLGNVVQEFLLRRLTHKPPTYNNPNTP